MKKTGIVKLLSSFVFPVIFLSCSNNKSIDYLSLGEEQRNGAFSQRLLRLDYVDSNSSDKNKVGIELEFAIRSYHKNTVSLKSSYSIVFDNNPTGTVVNYYQVQSIAPGYEETIILKTDCFKDWRNATITYNPYQYIDGNDTYSFSVKSEDFPDKLNNCYPTLKQDESFHISKYVTLELLSLQTTTIGSAYVKEGESNLEIRYSILNLVHKDISLQQFAYRVGVNDDGMSARITVSSPTPPSVIKASSTTEFEHIIAVNNMWTRMVFSYETDTFRYAFNLLNSDFIDA